MSSPPPALPSLAPGGGLVAPPPPEPNSSGGGPPAPEPKPRENEEQPSEGEVAPKSDARRASEGFVAFSKGFDECEVTPGPTNPVKRDTANRLGQVNLSPATPLRSIAGVPITELKIDDLRMFCSKNGIKGSRKAKKAPICWAICRARDAYLAGNPGPYRDLIPLTDGGSAMMEGEGGSGGEQAMVALPPGMGDAPESARKKRRVNDDNDDAILGPAAKTHNKRGGNDAPSWQHRVALTRERANRAIEMRETVEAAALLRRELREEEDRRARLWREHVAAVGDEGAATAQVEAAKQGGVTSVEDEAKGAEALVESIVNQDALVDRLAERVAVLDGAVDRLLPREDTVEPVDISV